MGIVRGHVVLNVAVEGFRGTRLLIVEPVTAPNLRIDTVVGGGRALVVADNLNPGEGQLIGFVEGREAGQPVSTPRPFPSTPSAHSSSTKWNIILRQPDRKARKQHEQFRSHSIQSRRRAGH